MSYFSPFASFLKAVETALTSKKPMRIIYNGATTICIFHDGTKVTARPGAGEAFDKEAGVSACVVKYIYGSRSAFKRAVAGGYDQTPEVRN